MGFNRITISKKTLTSLQKLQTITDKKSLKDFVHKILDFYISMYDPGVMGDISVPKTDNTDSLKRSIRRYTKQVSVFHKDIPQEIEECAKWLCLAKDQHFSLPELCQMTLQKCPLLVSYLKKISLRPKDKDGDARQSNMLAVVIMLISNISNKHASTFSATIGQILFSCNISARVIDLLCKYGLSCSYSTVTYQMNNHIIKRHIEFQARLSRRWNLPLIYADNCEYRVEGKFAINSHQHQLLSTITTLGRTIVVENIPNIVIMNQQVMFFEMPYRKIESLADAHHNDLVKKCLQNALIFKENVTSSYNRSNYLSYDCWPSYLGNGNSNKDKLSYFEYLSKEVLSQHQGVAFGDQVFAAFLMRCHKHELFMDIWSVCGDWHFHFNLMRAMVKHGWEFFQPITSLLQSKVTKKGQHYNDLKAFVETFTKGFGLWLVRAFFKSTDYFVLRDEEYKILSYNIEELRRHYKTFDTLFHLFELGVDCMAVHQNIRTNNGKDQMLMWARSLHLFHSSNCRNYFQLAVNETNQLTYLQENQPHFFDTIINNRNVLISGLETDGHCVAADEFVEMNHATLKQSRLSINEETVPKAIQRRIYGRNFERNLSASEKEYKGKGWSLRKGAIVLVEKLDECLGSTFDLIDKRLQELETKGCVVNIFNNNSIISEEKDPLFKYQCSYDIMDDLVVDSLAKQVKNPIEDNHDCDEVDEVDEYYDSDDEYRFDDEQTTSEQIVINECEDVTIIDIAKVNTYNHKEETGRSWSHYYDNCTSNSLPKRSSFVGVSQDISQYYSFDNEEDEDFQPSEGHESEYIPSSSESEQEQNKKKRKRKKKEIPVKKGKKNKK